MTVSFALGHRALSEEAQILHRDISIGNIMMTSDADPQYGRRRGFLIDLDYAKDMAKPNAVPLPSTLQSLTSSPSSSSSIYSGPASTANPSTDKQKGPITVSSILQIRLID